MPCIPDLNWTEWGEDVQFSSFRLECADALRPPLATVLGALPLSSRADAVLRLRLEPDNCGGEEAHTLQIDKSGVEVTSPSPRGLYYALTSLKLLLASGGALRCGRAEGAPRFSHRGVMLDVSRGKMPTLDYLKALVSFLSDLKYNVLQLYCEDKLALRSHPEVGRATGAYTEAQIRELDEWCQARYVELQPCIQTYSHMHGVLRLPGYSALAENPVLFSLAAGNEAVYAFLEDEFRETLPWFTSKTLNINMDEAYDLGTGFTASAVEAEGKGRVFLRHIRRVAEIARRHGAGTILLWGDVANKYPELLSELPEDVIIADWNYNPQDSYPLLQNYERRGAPYWAAGGVSTWNSVFPRVYNSYQNLIGYSAEAYRRGASGFLVTDWGDYGHMQPLGLSLYGYMVGAQQAFWAADGRGEDIERMAWPLLFHDERVEGAFRHLMDSNLAPHLQTGFKTMSIHYFFDDLLDALALRGDERYPKLERETFRVLRVHGEAACRLLADVPARVDFPDQSWETLFGAHFLCELRLSARMTRFTGRKGELSFRIRDTLAHPGLGGDDILALIEAVKELYREFCAIRRMFEEVWLLRACEQGMENCLSLFDRAGVQLGEAVKWLARQWEALSRGEQADSGLETYRAAEGYGVLWTADFKNMWDRAYPWQ